MSPFRGTARRLVRRFGGGATVTITRANALRAGNTGDALTALTVRGSHLLGATTVDLEATKVRGQLKPGLEVTIDGNLHTVGAGRFVASSNRLDGVVISPGLVGALSGGETATVTASKTWTLEYAGRGFREQDLGSQIQATDRKFLCHLTGVPALHVPTEEDKLTDSNGRIRSISNVRPQGGGASPFAVVIQVGKVAA